MRSDIYSLGLILHEMFTGKRATLESGEAANSPTSIVKDLDPAVEKVILRCLEADPQNRPQSAVAMARALPAGDPLAAALAAGDTPSPEMVAAAGDNEGIAVRTAAIALGAVLVGLAVVAVLGHKTNILEQTPFDKSPAVLEQKARDLIQSFGYTEAPVDRAYGFSYDTEFQQYGEGLKDPAAYRALLAKGSPAVIRFWYRQSPQYLVAAAEQHIVSLANPPPIGSGMVSVNLNPQGLLIELTAVPPQVEKPVITAAPPDWAALFTAAGLDIAGFTPEEPEWLPLASFDARAAWTGVYPDTDLPLRIEAASWRGRPVNFQMIGPWTKPSRMQPIFNLPAMARIAVGILLILTVLAALLAWRHFRLKRGDAQGAFRLAVFVFSVEMMGWLCVADHVPGVEEIVGWMEAVSFALLAAGFFWTLYMALEPYVRRRWPQSMTAWSRLLRGGVRDPVVGGNLLIGVAFGVGTAAFFLVQNLVLKMYASGGRLDANTVATARLAAGTMISLTVFYIGFALAAFFLFFLLRALLRKPWIAAVAFTIIIGAIFRPTSVNHPLIAAVMNGIVSASFIFITVRFGLLAMMATFFASVTLIHYPATTDLSIWYAGSTLFAYAVVLALAGYAFHTAVGGRPLVKAGFLDAD